MKNGKILKIFTFTLSIVLSITLLVAPVNASLVFPDLTAEHWCYDKIIDFEEKGFVCGYEDGTFKPDQTITRAEYVKIVNNFFGYELEYDKDSGFSDINSGDWFVPYVNEAVERGYITGYKDGTFRPEDPIRRQEATVILSRILEIDEEEYPADHEDGLAQYSDGQEVEDWARVAIHSYSVYNFINGYEDGSLRILQDVTRAETVELLHILEQKIVVPDEKPNKDDDKDNDHDRSDIQAQPPVITAYEKVNGKKVPVEGWVNYETKYEKGSLIEIVPKTEGAINYYTLDGWKSDLKYENPFVLTEGKHKIGAFSTKTDYKNSSITTAYVNIDTVAPTASGVHEENTITISVEDYNYYEIAPEQLSGVSGESLRYAWFIYDDVKEDYVRETVWHEFENNQIIEIPEFEGAYYLGVKGSDVSGNKMGTGILDGVIADEDDEVDFPNTDEDDEPTDDPFIIINQLGKSYTLKVFSGGNISSVIGSGEYEYASMVTIDATLVNDGKYYEFLAWTGDTDKIANFDEEEKSQSFKMPATNLTLTAHAEEMDVDLNLEVSGFSGDDTKEIPEPGDWIEYELSIENLSDLKGIDLILELSVSGDSGDISGDKSIRLTVDEDDSTTIKFIAQIDETFGVYDNFIVNVVAKPAKNTEVELDEISLGQYTEKMSGIRYKQKTNKNIVMLIDVSASMGFCTEHPELPSTQKDYCGYVVLWEDILSGDYVDVNNIDNNLGYDESGDLVFNKSGELIIDYNQMASGSWKGHKYKEDGSDEYKPCVAPSRMDVLVDALVAKNTGFIDKIARGAVNNDEEVTITLVTFSGHVEKKPNDWLAANLGTFKINDSNLKTTIKNLKYRFHSGTYINSGLREVVNVFDVKQNRDELLSGDNVENYFIFFGDGQVSAESLDDRNGMLERLISGDSAEFDYSYAIGFGKDFTSGSDSYNLLKTLLKDSENELPIHAKNAEDIVKAFESIARNISATAQTENGKLTLKGAAFNDAVKNNKVFPIAVMDGNTKLFTITSTSDIQVVWNENTTNVEFKFDGSKLEEIVIDLSGTAFSNKKQLNIVFDKN